MKQLILTIKIVAGLAVLAAVLFVSHLVSEQFFPEVSQTGSTTVSGTDLVTDDEDSDKPKSLIVEGSTILELSQKLRRASEKSDYEPGEKAFASSCELLAGGAYYEAEAKLKQLVKRYPNAPSVPEARRILGQRNIDRFLGDTVSGGKRAYKVKGGDSFIKIAKQNKTSLDNLMLINGLYKMSNNLHKGEELLVMPLHFNLVVDIPNRRLTLEYGKEFVKDYPFKKLVAPGGSGSRKSYVQAVESKLPNGRNVGATSDRFRQARKVIVVKRPLMEIVGDDHAVDEAFQGVILERSQVEELAVLLRRGNLVETRY